MTDGSSHSSLGGVSFELVFPAGTESRGPRPLVCVQKNFPTQEKDLWPHLLEMHLLDMTLEYHWKVLGWMLVPSCLQGLCTRAVVHAGPEGEGQHSVHLSGFIVDGGI